MVFRNLERQPLRAALSVLGIALAVAVLLVGLAFMDVMESLIDQQFARVLRQDATLGFVRPASASAIHAVAHLPGVMDIEPMRAVAVRLRSGQRSRTLALMGTSTSPRLSRIVDRDGRVRSLPDQGLVLSQMLGSLLQVQRGDRVQVEVLEGPRPIHTFEVADLVDDSLGLQAYVHVDALRRLLREDAAVSGVHVTIDPHQLPAFYDHVKAMPAVAGVALRDVMLRNFREAMAENMNLSIFFNVAFAAVIAFGVVYNAARVSLSERERELASLRVLGFTRGEISMVLLGELAALTLLALPVGGAIGYGLGAFIMLGFNNEVYRLSFVVQPSTVAWACLVVMAAALGSGLLVRRRLDGLDLVAVLKTRE
jgi:putative ABC transport system permease protein